MERALVENILQSALDSARNRRETEHPKIDLKRCWWHFDSHTGEEEFVKDIATIANTPGGDGFIIVGLDPDGTLYDSPLASSGYDEADLQSKANAAIYPRVNWEVHEFHIDGKRISVIAIAKSRARPHFVRVWKEREQCIFIRSGTRREFATRWDLDEMYGDRPADAQLIFHVTSETLSVSGGLRFDSVLVTAGRPEVVVKGTMSIFHTIRSFGPFPVSLLRIRGYDEVITLPQPFEPNKGYVLSLFFDIPNEVYSEIGTLGGERAAYRVMLETTDSTTITDSGSLEIVG